MNLIIPMYINKEYHVQNIPVLCYVTFFFLLDALFTQHNFGFYFLLCKLQKHGKVEHTGIISTSVLLFTLLQLNHTLQSSPNCIQDMF
uniref:Uncharacterized protein n=1 Tax=Anguilla anguilla TaxID=7936 RepID=A0A0E9WWH3_ANGAN